MVDSATGCVLFGLVLAGPALPASSSITFVQSASAFPGGVQTASKAFPGYVTAGDLILIGTFVDPNATVTVSDSQANSFTQVAMQTVTTDHIATVAVATAKSSGTDTITVSVGRGTKVWAFSIHEYSGVSATVDTLVSAQGHSTSLNGGSLATTNANDLIFAWFTNGSNFRGENFTSLSSAYTKREISGTGTDQCWGMSNCVESADIITGTTLTTSATATISVSDIWSATVIAFKAATTGTGQTYSISGTVSGSAATVTLSGASSATTTVAAGVTYSFSGLANGSYTVTATQSGYTFSPASTPVTVSGANVTRVNFTGTPITYSISGTVSGSAATVTLSGTSSATTTIAAGGTYTFSGLANGSYTVTATQSGYTFSPASTPVTVSGSNVTSVNFTGTPITYSISGTVSGSAATVTLSGTSSATTTIAAGGTYTFSGLANGSYTVTPTQSGYTFSPASTPVTVSGADVTGVNFAGIANNSSQPIAFVQSASVFPGGVQTASKAFPGNVTAGDLILVGTFVDPNATVTVSDSQGNSFTQVAVQTVTTDHTATVAVATSKSSGTDTITVSVGSRKKVWAFSIHEYSGVSATVDTSVTAQGQSTSLNSGSLTTTNANDLIFAWFTNGSNVRGENFTSLNSAYTKREISGTGTDQCWGMSNCVESADIITDTTLTTNATATLSVSDIWSATVIAFKAATTGTGQTYSISGTVSGSPATVTLSGASSATTTVAAGGTYTFSGLANGSYTVTAAQSGYTFSPTSTSVTVSGGNVTNVNFTGTGVVTGNTYSISGTVTGSAATLTLSGTASATTATNANGTYTFSGLANGLYVASASQPGYYFTPVTASVTVNGANVTGVNFAATPSSTEVLLNWVGSISPNVNGYNVYRATISGGPYTQINSSQVAGTAYADTNVSSGTTYYYVTVAVDSANSQSGYSNQAVAIMP